MPTTTAHCLCGSSCRITTDEPILTGAVGLWWQVHTGPGHGPATPAQARAAQRASYTSNPSAPADPHQGPA